MHNHLALAGLACLGLLGACNSGAPDNTDRAEPAETSSPVQSALETAWARARAGENPTRDCTVVKARTISSDDPNLASAASECNYDIPVAYFNALLDDVEAGTRTCKEFSTSLMTQLSAMTMSLGGLQRAAAKSRNGTSDSDAASAVLNDAMTGEATIDAKDRVKTALAGRASAACPILSMYFKR